MGILHASKVLSDGDFQLTAFKLALSFPSNALLPKLFNL